MTTRWFAIVLLACVSACVADNDTDDDPPPPASDDGLASASASVIAPSDDDAYNVCEHLPPDPPCSLICDREALAEYVPESSCAVFACVLTDGREVAVHACHPAD
jgi:hypothetical protein